jgi:hypothetical protein
VIAAAVATAAAAAATANSTANRLAIEPCCITALILLAHLLLRLLLRLLLLWQCLLLSVIPSLALVLRLLLCTHGFGGHHVDGRQVGRAHEIERVDGAAEEFDGHPALHAAAACDKGLGPAQRGRQTRRAP